MDALLTNSGSIALTDDSYVFGDVTNAAGGRIVVSGGAVATFIDDVVNNGTHIRTSAGSGVVFLGSLTGSGAYTGTGTVYIEGDLRPGNSPALVTFEGDLVFGSLAEYDAELAGPAAGAQYDRLAVAARRSLTVRCASRSSTDSRLPRGSRSRS